jgi:large subunit ribosomal protein L29
MSDSVQSMTNEQLAEGLASSERELVTLRFAHSMNQLENTSRLRVIRKQIARLKTEARTREMAAGLSKGTLERALKGGTPSSVASAGGERGGFLKGIVDKLSSNE